MEGTPDDAIVVKYIKVDGQQIDNPIPKFEYEVKIGKWRMRVTAERYADFFRARENKDVEVEIGTQFGALHDIGRVSLWFGNLPDAPSFMAKIEGSDPMQFIDR